MLREILTTRVPESNPQPLDERIANAHRDVQSMIDWLSIPGAALRYNLDAEFLLTMFIYLKHGCNPAESIEDIEVLVAYVKGEVQPCQQA